MEPLPRFHHCHLRFRLPPPPPLPPPPLHHHRRCLTSLLLLRRCDRGRPLLVRAEPPSAEAGSGESSGEASPAAPSPSPKKPDGQGTGFGGSAAAEPKKKKKGKGKERSAVVRRSPIDKSSLVYSASKENQPPQQQEQQLAVNESAFLLTWLGLGAVILVEGIALAASGFLPEEWDGFFVKYLYPSFTPTVLLFLCGTVAYGVFKYLQAEKMKS